MKRYEFEEEKLKILLYGQPGSGKTRLASTAAWDERLAPALMLEAFGNPISIRDYDQRPDIVTIEDMSDFNRPYQWFQMGQPEDAPFVADHNLNPPYKTLIVDGLTEVQRFVIRKISGLDFTSPGTLTPKMDRQGFGRLLGTMLNWALHYVQLDVNVILTSLEADKTAGEGRKCWPLLWGQAGNEICGYVYSVARLVTQLNAPKYLLTAEEDPLTKQTQNVALFRETKTYYGKDQCGMSRHHVTDPTLTKIMDLLSGASTQP